MTPPRSPAPQRGARLGNKRPAARRRPRAGTPCCEISERRAPAHPQGRRARRATGNTAPAPREGAAPNFEVLEATIDTAHTCFPTGVQPWPFLLRVCLPAYSCPALRRVPALCLWSTPPACGASPLLFPCGPGAGRLYTPPGSPSWAFCCSLARRGIFFAAESVVRPTVLLFPHLCLERRPPLAPLACVEARPGARQRPARSHSVCWLRL